MREVTKKGEGVATQFFAVRWLTTLFSREFSLEETLRVWDSLLGDPERLLLVYCVATALMQNVQSVLMEKDFSQAMQILQNVAIPSTETILQMADAIRFKELKGRREDTSLSSQLRRAGESLVDGVRQGIPMLSRFAQSAWSSLGEPFVGKKWDDSMTRYELGDCWSGRGFSLLFS